MKTVSTFWQPAITLPFFYVMKAYRAIYWFASFKSRKLKVVVDGFKNSVKDYKRENGHEDV